MQPQSTRHCYNYLTSFYTFQLAWNVHLKRLIRQPASQTEKLKVYIFSMQIDFPQCIHINIYQVRSISISLTLSTKMFKDPNNLKFQNPVFSLIFNSRTLPQIIYIILIFTLLLSFHLAFLLSNVEFLVVYYFKHFWLKGFFY